MNTGDQQPANNDLHRSENLGHEHRDVSVRGALWAAFGLAATMVVSMVVVYFIVDLSAEPRDADATRATRTLEPGPIMFDSPQANQSLVRKQQEQAREQILSSYTWIDAQQGVARIPIERSMNILAEQPELFRAIPQAAESVAEPAGEEAEDNAS